MNGDDMASVPASIAWRVAGGAFARADAWAGLNFLSTALVMGTAGLVGLGFLLPVLGWH